QLRTKANASTTGYRAVGAPGLEPGERAKLGSCIRSDVAEDLEPAVAELANEQIAFAVTIEISDPRRRVANVGVHEPILGFKTVGFLQFASDGFTGLNRQSRAATAA